MDELELASRLKNPEDGDVWTEFFALYWKVVLSAAMRRGCNYSDAEDVVQNTLVSVAQHIEKFNIDSAAGSFHGWVMRIAYCRIADHFRGHLKQRRQWGDPQDETVGGGEPIESNSEGTIDIWESLWIQEAKQRMLHEAMERVRSHVARKPYEAFRLAICDSASVAEISRQLGLRPAEIYLAKHRVKALLRKELRSLERDAG